MRRNCNLELRLLSPSFERHHQQSVKEKEVSDGSPKETQMNQKLTIFYNGIVSSCDVTELQARAIISLASQETEKPKTSPYVEPSSTMLIQSQSYKRSDLSMKRSLQQFLQKRKKRIQATSPYSH